MKKTAHDEHLPLMRTERLVVDELPDEMLVYDLDSHQAHCLNKTVALVWQNCDGRTSPAEIVKRLEDQLQAPCEDTHVWQALRQLEKIHLLKRAAQAPPPSLARVSRRQMVRTLGLAAAIAAPLVTSIVAPTAAEAATCAPSGASCALKPCCAGSVCNPVTTTCT